MESAQDADHCRSAGIKTSYKAKSNAVKAIVCQSSVDISRIRLRETGSIDGRWTDG